MLSLHRRKSSAICQAEIINKQITGKSDVPMVPFIRINNICGITAAAGIHSSQRTSG